MATVDLGKIKFQWRSAYADTTVYEADDVVSYSGSSFVYVGTVTAAAYDASTVYDQTVTNVAIGSDNKIYRYINAIPASGQDPTSTATHWEVNTPGTTSPATTFWDLMADGTTPLTTQGDILTHNGTTGVRLARGNSGDILTVSGNDVVFSPNQSFKGRGYLVTNYDLVANPSASTTYGANGSRPWLADYANNWIPESGIPNLACGPVALADGHERRAYRAIWYLNTNHEVVCRGTDGYYGLMGMSAGNTTQNGGTIMNIFPEFGGLADGEYFTRIWNSYQNLYLTTNKGSLFAGGYNGYGQLGVGDTTNRFGLVRVPGFGENESHGGVAGNRVAGFHVSNGGDGYGTQHHCYVINEHGKLFSWGYNGNGQLGNGNTTNQTRPQEITTVTGVTQIQGSYLTTYVSNASGNLFACGYNANGVLGGATLSANQTAFAQVSGVSNVYQFVQTTQTYYSGGWTYVGTGHYINTSGELYGTGYAGNGQLGDGTGTDKNAFTRIGGSSTFSQVVYAGNSLYNTVHALGGTPGSSNGDLSTWGYNGNGNIGNGNTTNQSSPQRPSTTMVYSATTTSTATDSAPTSTALSLPRDDVDKIFPTGGAQGQATSNLYVIGTNGQVYWNGYTQSFDYYQANTNNTNVNNYRIVQGPFSSAGSTANQQHWAGQDQRELVAITTSGYIYNSEGRYDAWFTDGTIMCIGYNGTGVIDTNAQYCSAWKQLN